MSKSVRQRKYRFIEVGIVAGLLALILPPYPVTEAQWLCRETSSVRTGNLFTGCGIGESASEEVAREQALESAKKEFSSFCDSSADCKMFEVNIVPKRTECILQNSKYKCYRAIDFEITDKVKDDFVDRDALKDALGKILSDWDRQNKSEDKRHENIEQKLIEVMEHYTFPKKWLVSLNGGAVDKTAESRSDQFNVFELSLERWLFSRIGLSLTGGKIVGRNEFDRHTTEGFSYGLGIPFYSKSLPEGFDFRLQELQRYFIIEPTVGKIDYVAERFVSDSSISGHIEKSDVNQLFYGLFLKYRVGFPPSKRDSSMGGVSFDLGLLHFEDSNLEDEGKNAVLLKGSIFIHF